MALRAAKSKIGKKEKSDRLYRAILMLETEEECYNFFQDLCTVSELRSMEQRYEVATLLNDGLIYNDILERTGASSATISRVNRSLIYGNGGRQVQHQLDGNGAAAEELFQKVPPLFVVHIGGQGIIRPGQRFVAAHASSSSSAFSSRSFIFSSTLS